MPLHKMTSAIPTAQTGTSMSFRSHDSLSVLLVRGGVSQVLSLSLFIPVICGLHMFFVDDFGLKAKGQNPESEAL